MRALLSVFDKTGVERLAVGLVSLGFELVASGGTSNVLLAAGIAHLSVEEVTGSPEMLSGRVKTLHPAIHGGILAEADNPRHRAELQERQIEPIELVVCNLYPFRSSPSVEMIDIGGPAMVRAAAKNHEHVAVVVDPADYEVVLDELRQAGHVTAPTRRRLARAAFAHVAAYDASIVSWFDSATPEGRGGLPSSLHLSLEHVQELRYGENPHQLGARYRSIGGDGGFWESVEQHGGRDLSYLNLFDVDAAWRLVHELAELRGSMAAVVVKHANPCGAAIASDIVTAYELAFRGDAEAAFGGVVAVTGEVAESLAEAIVGNPLADVLVAPGYSEGALALFGERRKNMRALQARAPGPLRLGLRQIDGGYLVQEPDEMSARHDSWHIVTEVAPQDEQWSDLELAWLVCARSTSNAVAVASRGQVVGVGCGQQSRVDAATLACSKAGGRIAGAVAASDGFFPFRDSLDVLADAGVRAVVQPGGSLRDAELVAAANERGLAMVLTGERHFRH
ncbi:MAG: bifunctional phosphoribosylaminoimidazolecarboxamide formyltransferase/IMP cyclohydrolase [Acidimicrobiales bacterium]